MPETVPVGIKQKEKKLSTRVHVDIPSLQSKLIQKWLHPVKKLEWQLHQYFA